MRIALIGTGRMGVAVESFAASHGHDIVARINRQRPLSGPELLADADVAIDFSLPHVAASHVKTCVVAHVPVVVGTTGWYDDLPQIENLVRLNRSAVLYSPNFSLGVQLMSHVLETAAKLLNHLPEYDVAIHEVHHTGKVDRPSGTAIKLADTILENLQRKSRWECAKSEGPHTLEITSTRVGSVFGDHEVIIDSLNDQLTVTHLAKSRSGFAIGAIKAAEWIIGKTGLFTLEDMLSDWTAG